jgi:hypothetical protein
MKSGKGEHTNANQKELLEHLKNTKRHKQWEDKLKVGRSSEEI